MYVTLSSVTDLLTLMPFVYTPYSYSILLSNLDMISPSFSLNTTSHMADITIFSLNVTGLQYVVKKA